MKYNNFFELINEYNNIVIFRHTRPDLDALGSQFGLYYILKTNYPNKNIYKVGDTSTRYSFLGDLDEVSDELIKDSLGIIVDVAVEALVSDSRYKLCKDLIVIDHHKNECNLNPTLKIVETDRIAAAELIADIFLSARLTQYVSLFPKEAATALYGGLVTDSGRFQYNNNSRPFEVAAELVKLGADMQYIYNNIYVETLKERKMKNFFANHYTTTDYGVAYMFNDQEVIDKFDCSFFDISRGMVNVMAGIEEINIWANFTYDKENDKVIGEFRSRGIEIVDIAKKYGGGGHACACGATLADFAEAKKVIEDFINLNKERNK